MDLDFGKLRMLVEVRDAGSMTGAAARLGYTPGAVSQQMAALQRAVHAELLEHVGRRVRLTDQGQVMAEYAQRMLALADEAEDALGALADNPRATVTVGVFGSAASALLPLAVFRVRQRYPAVTLRSIEVDVDEATSAVASRRVDVAFGVDYPQTPIPRAPDVITAVVASERFAMALPAGRANGTAALRDFADDRWILPPEGTFYGRAIRTACRRANFEPHVEHVVTDTASTLALVAAGLGIAPVTDLMLLLRSAGLSVAPLREAVERTIVLAYRSVPSPQPGVLAVVEAITDAVSARSVGVGAGPAKVAG